MQCSYSVTKLWVLCLVRFHNRQAPSLTQRRVANLVRFPNLFDFFFDPPIFSFLKKVSGIHTYHWKYYNIQLGEPPTKEKTFFGRSLPNKHSNTKMHNCTWHGFQCTVFTYCRSCQSFRVTCSDMTSASRWQWIGWPKNWLLVVRMEHPISIAVVILEVRS